MLLVVQHRDQDIEVRQHLPQRRFAGQRLSQ
jgi:hypothetical protein